MNKPAPVLRPELEKLPLRMQSLPVHRGYPVPWFVAWVTDDSGERIPEFRALDPHKWVTAVRQHLCWVCGYKLGTHLAFVIGPMCGITRVTSEPPCHLDCAEWSARNCPFLSRPDMVRRDVEPQYGSKLIVQEGHLDRNPGCTLVWVCYDFEPFSDGRGGYLLHLGDPHALSFWSMGKPASRAQIETSVQTGIPLLVANDPDLNMDTLNSAVKSFREFLPAI